MEYNIIVAPYLVLLAKEVGGFIPMGWKLKGGILEHSDGYAQQLVRSPRDIIKLQAKSPVAKKDLNGLNNATVCITEDLPDGSFLARVTYRHIAVKIPVHILFQNGVRARYQPKVYGIIDTELC